jgi:hypothetical protein
MQPTANVGWGKPCECEHAAHFAECLTPNGNLGHQYGKRFATTFLSALKTTGGTFTVCRDCAADCMVAVTLDDRIGAKHWLEQPDLTNPRPDA